MEAEEMASYDFRERYSGPDGPHLSCLTRFTLTRDEAKRGGFSIHRRVSEGRTRFDKANTCASPSKERKQRLIEAISEHCKRHPNDGRSAARLAKLTAA